VAALSTKVPGGQDVLWCSFIWS